MRKLWKNHKTKLLGLAVAVISAVQAGAAYLGTLLSPTTYAMVMLTLGVVVTIVGFINTALQTSAQ